MDVSKMINGEWLNPVLDKMGLSYASNRNNRLNACIKRAAIKIIINFSIAMAATIAIGLITPLPFSAIVLLSVVAGVTAGFTVKEEPLYEDPHFIIRKVFDAEKKLFAD